MKKNMASWDRLGRVLIALVFVILNVTGAVTGAFSIILWVFAGIFLLTSLVGFCPLYAPFRFSTMKKKE